MHVFFTSQGDIMKLGLDSSSLSGAFLETLPPISVLFHFYLNYTEHILELLGDSGSIGNGPFFLVKM